MKTMRWQAARFAYVLLASILMASFSGWAQTETVPYSFTGGSDGQQPNGSLIADNDGNLYGTTALGGAGCGLYTCGVVFELSPLAAGGWRFTVLHTFTGGSDGGQPIGGLAFDSAGNLYGTTTIGGDTSSHSRCGSYYSPGCGVVFELSRSPTGWEEKVLHVFTGGEDGAEPNGGLVFDQEGNLYGTTEEGGELQNGGFGVVYELSATASGRWKETLLHIFSNRADGGKPQNGVILDPAGNVYGTGGSGGSFGAGVVFELSSNSAGGWSETVLYNFFGHGAGPGGLVRDPAGNLYGATEFGGTPDRSCPSGCGTVYELSRTTSGDWEETVLHALSGGVDGSNPLGGLTLDGSGSLYGTASGEYTCCGVLFRVSKEANGEWADRVLYSFNAVGDGTVPIGGLLLDSAGNLYGATATGGDYSLGAIFEIVPQSDWQTPQSRAGWPGCFFCGTGLVGLSSIGWSRMSNSEIQTR